MTAQKFGPSWQIRPAIVTVDRPAPEKLMRSDDESARLRVGWGAHGVGAFFRKSWQISFTKLNRRCRP
jgi:predicted 3-demethylubiquinone-9 3-methyltransferase (glyoxalase superfamily)